MLQLDIAEQEMFNEETNEFSTIKPMVLRLEHSLVSLSKWEMRWKKPFLSREKKTRDEVLDYIRCMTLNQNVQPEVYYSLTVSQINQVTDYIQSDFTATTFNERETPSREVFTSEIIYYYMVANGIPFECQKWHLSRLLTLIRVCSIKNNPGKKMSHQDIFARNRKLNAARRKAMHTKG